MKISLFKRIMVVSLSAVMTIGMTGVISARQFDGQNVAANNVWTSFSVLTDDAKWAADDPTCGTKGWFATGKTASAFDFVIASTGWDGEWNTHVDPPVLAGDMPWGLTASSSENIPVEAGRSYTISFKIKSTLYAAATVATDDKPAVPEQNTKHMYMKAYTMDDGAPALDLSGANNVSADGYFTATNGEDYKSISATVSIPSDYTKKYIGFKFAFGALMKTYPDELGMKGHVYLKDFKITANKQYSVTFKSRGKTVATKWVNPNWKVSTYKAKRKKYTLAGYTLNGKTYNFASPVKGNITLVAKWKKTAKPAKIKLASVKSSRAKRAVVRIKKAKKVKGYVVQYATNKKFKKAKSKSTKKTKLTLKKLKSGSIVYVRAKAYVTDSTGAKVLGKKWSARKIVVVK